MCVCVGVFDPCQCLFLSFVRTLTHTHRDTHKIKLFHKCHSKHILKTLTASRLAMEPWNRAYIVEEREREGMGVGERERETMGQRKNETSVDQPPLHELDAVSGSRGPSTRSVSLPCSHFLLLPAHRPPHHQPRPLLHLFHFHRPARAIAKVPSILC